MSVVTPACAQDQDTAPPAGPGNEILVTAQKRSENIQDVPFSITALTGDILAERGQDNFADFAKSVPGLSFVDLGPGQSQISIRGINTGAVARDDTARKESVGVYLNDVAVSVALFNPDLDTFDLARVEVLRGPQGTLYGSGSLAGTVRFITTPPSTTRLEGKGDFTVSATRGSSDPNYQIKGAINVPVAPGLAGVRVVGYYNSFDGFIDNIATGENDVNRSRKYGTRVAAKITPTPDWTITPSFVWQRIRTYGYPMDDVASIIGTSDGSADPAAPVQQTPDPLEDGQFLLGNPVGSTYEQYRETPEGLRDDFKVYSLESEYDFGPATLTSVSALLEREVVALRDFTFYLDSALGAVPTINYGTPPSLLTDATDLSTFTQEIRLGSSGINRFQWVAGMFYQREEREYGQDLLSPGFEEQSGLPASLAGLGEDVLYKTAFDLDLRQFAVFGEGTYELVEGLRATVGLRWYDYTQSRDARLEGLLNDLAVTAQSTSTSDNGVNPRFILAYKPSPNVTVSAQAAKGFKLGGPSEPIPGICSADAAAAGITSGEFAAESLWNYEVGVKASLARGRLVLNAAAFQIDYTDLQLNRRLACSFSVTTNAGKARSRGLEMELLAQPIDNLSLTLSGSYIDAQMRTDEPSLNAMKGDRLPLSPEFQFSFGTRYTLPLNATWSAFADGMVQHVGDQISYFNSAVPGGSPVDPYGNEVAAYDLVNLRLGASNGLYEVALFVENLFDKRAALTIDRERAGYLVTGDLGRNARTSLLRNRPRTIGANLKVNF